MHIPKCAGNSIQQVLWPGDRRVEELRGGFVDRYRNQYQTGGLQHLLAKQIRQEVGADVFDAYFKFAVVRNPFDRAVSQFAYMQNRRDLREFIGMREDTSFAEYLDLIRRRRHVQWEPQCSFLYEADSLLVDFVGRFETLESDAGEVFARLGVDCDALPHQHASDRRPYLEYYTPECRARIEEMYGDDLTNFGYSFEEPAQL